MAPMSLPILNPLHWGYNGTVKHVKSNSMVELDLQNGDKIKFDEFVKKYVPGVDDNAHFKLNPKLFTGYLQSMYLTAGDFSKSFQVFYGREIFKFKDGGVASCDYVMNDVWDKKYFSEGKYDKEAFKKDEAATHLEGWPRLHPRTRHLTEEELDQVNGEHEKPLLIIMHGLCGGSFEAIIRSLCDKMDLNKFQVVVLNTRGCARTKITTKQLFSAYATGDLRELIDSKLSKNPSRHIYTAGFSFGSTILSNFLGEEGANCKVKAAATLCNPWDLVHSSEKMTFDFWSSRMFSKAVSQFLVRTVEVNMNALEQPEDVNNEVEEEISHHKPSTHVFTRSNLKKAKKFSTTVEFDQTFTAPSLGFPSALEYYDAAGSINRLPSIKVPLLAINAEDDPVVGTTNEKLTSAVEGNPNVLYCSTDLGGHLSYLDKNNDTWATRQMAHFFEKFEDVVN
ncbi:hypothetical protein ACO0RG_002799 [Hanseniaspora osmophila]|uniref:Medium-chain fatty acid ethyl ester synthase/esterase 2 n=1 Tax=Hanseniaspora osmophila TaxID=56408 RepID=A0A1E5R8B4_9ASCO|nr:Medium-chain fatty acid ethyl ester synthase/esterase 2 [Hanseniaspora osmophila]